MSILILLWGVFETQLFPYSIFFEHQFNPVLVERDRFTFALQSESHFSLPGVHTYKVFANLKYCSLKLMSFGNKYYHENGLKIGIAIPYSPCFTAGFKLGLLNYWIEGNTYDFGYTFAFAGRVGMRNISFDACCDNVKSTKFSNYDVLPITYSFRINYAAEKIFTAKFALRGQIKNPPFCTVGLLCQPAEILRIGVALNTEPVYLEYHIAVSAVGLTVGYIGKTYQYLGQSHAFNIAFTL